MRSRFIPLARAAAAAMLFAACDESPTGSFPDSLEEVERAAIEAEAVGAAAEQDFQARIEAAVAANAFIDPEALAAELEGVEGVESAEVAGSGTVIHLRQSEGVYLNLLLDRRNDERLYVPAPSQAADLRPGAPSRVRTLLFPGQPAAATFPTGSKAVILAPFQHEFQEDLEAVAAPLRDAGFTVEIYQNEQAGLDQFRGSFLSQFDVVYITSHGSSEGMSRGGTSETVILTGTELSPAADRAMFQQSRAEYDLISAGRVQSGTYYSVSGSWLDQTGGQFNDTWFFVNACESATHDSGPKSLSAALFGMGASGFNGWDETVHVRLAEAAAEKLLAHLASGRSLSEATELVRGDLGLRLYAWWLRIGLSNDDESTARIELLDGDKRNADDFYLFDPARVVGTAAVVPSSGPVGTAVVYEVRINAQFASAVARVEFDIDHTGEHLTMTRGTDGVWRRTNLTAPVAEAYPRIDTFTFTALRSNGSVVGRGSATFTIQGGPSSSLHPAGTRYGRIEPTDR